MKKNGLAVASLTVWTVLVCMTVSLSLYNFFGTAALDRSFSRWQAFSAENWHVMLISQQASGVHLLTQVRVSSDSLAAPIFLNRIH